MNQFQNGENKMEKVHIVSKMEFDYMMSANKIDDNNVEQFSDFMLISIIDTQNRQGPHFKENHENVINFRFDDVEHDNEPSPTQEYETKAFSKEQATQLYKFIKKNQNKKICVVHCMAGISRSGAVGAFVNDYCGGDWDQFKRNNRHIVPNPRISRMLNQVMREDFKN